MRYDRTVIGYHGCDLETAQGLLNGSKKFEASTNRYDWLGHGIYFWEYGPDRAWQFAEFQRQRGHVQTPAVVGAVIQLGRCFDLLDTQNTRALAEFYPEWQRRMQEDGRAIPHNRGTPPDYKGRYLDCAVLNNYLQVATEMETNYDTVRGVFQEGGVAYPGAGIRLESHIQIAVRASDCILGVFRPLNGGNAP